MSSKHTPTFTAMINKHMGIIYEGLFLGRVENIALKVFYQNVPSKSKSEHP